jgi:regulator of sigma E protease
MLLTIIAGVIVLSVLIIAHELGHFIAAKATHNYVEEFGIGFPPRLWGKKWGETIYSINWIPFGGFNKLSGEVDPAAPRALAARSHAVRLLVMSGGMIMNLLLPLVLLTVAYMVPHDIAVGKIVVQELVEGTPAALAGIRVGDNIVAVNGNEVRNTGELSSYVLMKMGAKITLSVIHVDGTAEDIKVLARWKPPEGQSNTGSVSRMVEPIEIVSESLPVWEAVPESARTCYETLVLTWNGIVGMFNGTVPFVAAGPVGIVQVAGEVAQLGISPLLQMAAVISIAIAITQLIPFPALDGARIFFIVLEWARRGKRVSPRVETIIHSIGFFILLALMVLITYQDLVRWITGGSLLD